MPEVIQDGGISLDPEDIPSISLAMKRVLTDDQFYHDLSHRALKRSNNFSWRKTAEEHLEFYLKHARKPE
jgi:glycosyltransferase involved in cell wall biosynthesis